METKCGIFGKRFLIPAFVLLILLISCERKADPLANAEILTLPSHTVIDFETIFTDSGKVQLIMRAPLMERYDKTEIPYAEFKSGMYIEFWDGHEKPVATASSKYARYTEDKKKIWELKDSVVVINEDNDKLETEQLFWDEEKDQIYTDRFVKITSEVQTIMGTGFESDSRLTRRVIKNVTATIYVDD
jgi:LPS export ABC transporter protein LptC